MPRYFIVAGIDFGTSFTKVVLRDNNAPGSKAIVVRFPNYENGLLPSLVGASGANLSLPPFASGATKIPYLKIVAAHVAEGSPLNHTPVRIPAVMNKLCQVQPAHAVVRDFLAFYFAHVIAATEEFIRTQSPWKDFDFTLESSVDFLIYQLAVPTGMLTKKGKTEALFREAFILGYELRGAIGTSMTDDMPYKVWAEKTDQVVSTNHGWNSQFKWQCLLYPEVAAAVQTVFRSPNSKDGLYITMDIGAGTVDMNAFCRYTGNGEHLLNYYSAIVSPLGIQKLNDPHRAVKRLSENELIENLRQSLVTLYQRAVIYQPNLGSIPGQRTWDKATFFIFGGGARSSVYQDSFYYGLLDAGINRPQLYYLPAAMDITCPTDAEFGRFAVAYGLSFFRQSLDIVSLPHELATFSQLYPKLMKSYPQHYGVNWED